MIQTSGDTTTIRPTPWKWYMGAAITGVLWLTTANGVSTTTSLLFFGAAILFAGLGSGKVANLELSPHGIKSRNLWKTRAYAWSDVEDFKIASIRTSLFTSTKMLAFSRKDKKETFSGKASRFLAGGTETIPLNGISPNEMMACVGGYQARALMAQSLSQTSAPVGFGRPETVPSPAQPVTASQALPQIFGRQTPSTPAARPATKSTSFGKGPASHRRPKSDPLVQEGGLFRKRRDNSGF